MLKWGLPVILTLLKLEPGANAGAQSYYETKIIKSEQHNQGPHFYRVKGA
ncbi:hypothetical protein GCM10010912_05060 [Paenibacillus albidus]|uniref:Uncharacterized protein n=1 Tax=Paenibacillus albidus TaxID=2041023 RepID=A0A917FBD1_9BACL|nr:hypothetical protein GCM10010912_05060 [Paenibacillus albidus]